MQEEERKEMKKPTKTRVPNFVGKEEAEQMAGRAPPQLPETNPEKSPLFQKLDRIADNLEARENGIIHQLCRIADALEKKPIPVKTGQVSPEVAKTIQNPPTPTSAPQPPKSEPVQPASQPTQAAPVSTTAPPKGGQSWENLRMMFTQDLEGMLIFEDKGEYIKITPRQYLGSDNFAKIAGVIREAGGEYVSAGKGSHFRVPK